MRPEFIARVDEVVVFEPLSSDALQKIAVIMLNELKTALSERNIDFIFDDNVSRYIAQKCGNTKTGARELRNIIRREIETKVVDMIITENISSSQKLCVCVNNNSLVLNFS